MLKEMTKVDIDRIFDMFIKKEVVDKESVHDWYSHPL